MFQTGDIIKSTASRNPFLFHRGVVIIEGGDVLIAHNTPMKRNSFGGNVVVDTLEQFLDDGRKILEVAPSCLERHEIDFGLEQMKYMRFDSFNFNCEHFVHYLATCRKDSPQLDKWVWMALCGCGLWMLS